MTRGSAKIDKDRTEAANIFGAPIAMYLPVAVQVIEPGTLWPILWGHFWFLLTKCLIVLH